MNIQVTYKALSELTPYAGNSRTHSEIQVEQIAKSISDFGFINPVLCDANGLIIAGHGRVMAAQKLNLDSVPVVVLDHLSDAQRRALTIADNKIALNAGWDIEKLSQELCELADEGYELDIVGFDSGEIESLLDGDFSFLDAPKRDPQFEESEIRSESDGNSESVTPSNDTDVIAETESDNDVPEQPSNPVSVLGDVWILGNHKVVCGDSRDAQQIAMLMSGKKADMVFTDPPYNLKSSSLGVSGSENSIGKMHGDFVMASGEMSEEEFTSFLRNIFDNLVSFSKDGAIHYVCMDWRHMFEVLKASDAYLTDNQRGRGGGARSKAANCLE